MKQKDPQQQVPTALGGRIGFVDALRGFAMMGIMLVNFPTMNTVAGEETTHYGGVTSALDRAAEFVNMALCNGKFYPIFALLFGLGLFLFMSNHEARGGNTVAFMGKRLLLLLAIGIAHMVFVWWGDILIVYALLGLVAMFGFRWTSQSLLRAALALLVFAPLLSPVLKMLDSAGLLNSQAPLIFGLNLSAPTKEQIVATYTQGSFAAMLHQRAYDYVSDFTPFAGQSVTLADLAPYASYYCRLLGLFLLGLWVGKEGIHRSITQERQRTLRVWLVVTMVALLFTIARYSFSGLTGFLYYYQGDAVALFYVLSFSLVFPRTQTMLAPVEAVGRLSLTAYLGHTIVASLILYGTGLGLYGKVGPAVLLPTALIFYSLMAWGCLFWSRHFLFGPVEWLWRSALYGRFQPFVKADEPRRVAGVRVPQIPSAGPEPIGRQDHAAPAPATRPTLPRVDHP